MHTFLPPDGGVPNLVAFPKLVFAPRSGKLPPLNNLLANRWSRYLLAVVAGLLLAAAFPNFIPDFNLAGFAWIAPALMLTAAHGTRGWETFRIGYMAGLAHFLASLYWLLLIPVTGFPILGWLALSAFVALYPAVWVWAVSRFAIRESGWATRFHWSLAGAAVWVALEMIRARLFSGFPWNPLGASQYKLTPLIQIASVTGVYGVSFLVVWVSLSLFNAGQSILRDPARRLAWQAEIILPLAVVMTLFVFGSARLRSLPPPAATLRVTFVQPSIPQTMIWDTAENTNRFRQLLALTERALTNETDLLLWPEAALPNFNEASFTAITNLIQRHHVWMIFGADDVEPKLNPVGTERYDYYNAAFLFHPASSFAQVYRKQKLVIFGEYIPLVRWLPFVKWFTPITGGFTSGGKPVPFVLERRFPNRPGPDATPTEQAGLETGAPARVKTSALICFEDVFPHLAREYADADTDFLVNLTNDGWFGEGAEQWQHAAAAVFRAVENGLPLLRCCNNGLTCWVDARGSVQQIFRAETGGVYGAGFVTWKIPLLAPGEKRAPTFYNLHGDWFGWACVALAAPLLLAHRQRGDAFSQSAAP